MDSLWTKTAAQGAYPALSGDLTCDVAIIGGGMCGILTAYALRQKGVDAIVLEANTVGSGQTGGTTAKITLQHGLIYARLIRSFGYEKALQYAAANQKAIEAYRRIAQQLHVDCQLEERPAYLYALLDESIAALNAECDAYAQLGLQAVLTKQTSLPFPVACALKCEGQAQFHPLLFLSAVAEKVSVFASTRVRRVEDNKIFTDAGTVTASKIVFASHFPFVNVPGFYFARMHQERSYVLAVKRAEALDGMYLGIDAGEMTFRSYGNYLLLGGGDHRTGENSAGGQYELLREKAAEWFGDFEEAAAWSAQDCMTLDGIPYIGQFSASTPDWYVATGFNKWGMSGSMAAADILADQLTGEANPYAEVFSPQRFIPAAGVMNMIKEGGQAVKGIYKEFLSVPRDKLEALPKGHGGVVEFDGEKIGVYKEETGAIYTVSTRCPHLGCRLEWNPDEKSWECPCHGSRFDYKGRILNGPAQNDLEGADYAQFLRPQ